jgi:sirohydrochlorin ferrochelatase
MLVVGHGSRDVDGVDEFWALAETIRAVSGDLMTGFGFIELASPTIDEAIDELVARGATEIVSVPLVLLSAGHLKNDGPAALARARARHPAVHFALARDLGIEPNILEVAADRIRDAAGDANPEKLGVALIGRGSSDPDACADLWKVSRLLADGRGNGCGASAREPPWSRRCSCSPGCCGTGSTPRPPSGLRTTPTSRSATPVTWGLTRGWPSWYCSATGRPVTATCG